MVHWFHEYRLYLACVIHTKWKRWEMWDAEDGSSDRHLRWNQTLALILCRNGYTRNHQDSRMMRMMTYHCRGGFLVGNAFTCWVDDSRNQWNIELNAANTKLGFLQEEPVRLMLLWSNEVQQLFILTFQTGSEASDCTALLKKWGYPISIPSGWNLPSVLPSPQSTLPVFPDHGGETNEEVCPPDSTKLNPSSIRLTDTETLRAAVLRIRADPNYSSLLVQIQSILSELP